MTTNAPQGDRKPIKLIAIGYTSAMTVYVNLTKDEAIARYIRSNPHEEIATLTIKELTVTDEFEVYDIEATE